MRKKEKNFTPKRRHSLPFLFSGAAILSITFSTAIVFSVMLYFNSDYTISLQDVSAFSVLLLTLIQSIIITFALRRIFITPFIRLIDAMNTVAAGDFSIRLDSNNFQSDLSDVYTSFNTMVTELSRKDTLQSDFISNVSHEFKTPINAIEGYASLLQDRELSEEEEKNYVDKIMFNTQRLSCLVGNVLLLSKVNNQVVQPAHSSYRLDEQIRQSILALESKWAPKNIDFDIELEKIEYTGMENLMAHVWINLKENAIKFSQDGGLVTIQFYRQENNAVFTVRNFGISIPENSLDRVFGKFYQCDTSRKSEGHGLGLALAKKVLDSSNAHISVSSSTDCGTEFKVTLNLK